MPDVKEKPEAAQPAASPKKSLIPANLSGLLTKVAVFGVIGVVAIIAAFVLTTRVLKPMMAHSPASAQTAQAPAEEKKAEAKPAESKPAEEEKGKSEGKSEGEGEGGGEAASSNFFNIESIVVNPAGTGGTRYLSCGVSFEMAGAEDVKLMQAKEAQVKDLLITILSSKSVDELADIKLRNQMRRQIMAVANRYLAPAQVKAVYLTDFVLQ